MVKIIDESLESFVSNLHRQSDVFDPLVEGHLLEFIGSFEVTALLNL